MLRFGGTGLKQRGKITGVRVEFQIAKSEKRKHKGMPWRNERTMHHRNPLHFSRGYRLRWVPVMGLGLEFH